MGTTGGSGLKAVAWWSGEGLEVLLTCLYISLLLSGVDTPFYDDDVTNDAHDRPYTNLFNSNDIIPSFALSCFSCSHMYDLCSDVGSTYREIRSLDGYERY